MTIADELENVMQTGIGMALIKEARAIATEREHDAGEHYWHASLICPMAQWDYGVSAGYRVTFSQLRPILAKLRKQEEDADNFIRRFIIEEEDGTQHEPDPFAPVWHRHNLGGQFDADHTHPGGYYEHEHGNEPEPPAGGGDTS